MSEKVVKKRRGGRQKGVPNKSRKDLWALMDSGLKWEEVIKGLYDAARGVTIQEETRQGPRVYTRAPDSGAAKTLLEHRFGRAPESIKIEGENQDLFKPLVFVVPSVRTERLEGHKD